MTGFDLAKLVKESQQTFEFRISPAVIFKSDLDDMIETYKIKLIRFQDDEVIFNDLIKVMYKYFSKEIINELLETTIDEEKRKNIENEKN